MNLVDSCGWLEYLADGPLAGFYSEALLDAETLIVPTICIAEVYKKVLSQRGEHHALTTYSLMMRGRAIPLDHHSAIAAAALGHELGLPLADSIILATTRIHQAVLMTHDGHFRNIPGVNFLS